MRVVILPRSIGIPRRYVVSALAHGVLLTVWAWAPTRTTSFKPIGDSMTVGLVAAPPSGGGARTVTPPAPAPPVPAPVEPPPEPKGPSLQPEPKKPEAKPKDKKPDKKKDEEKPANTAATPSAAPPNDAPSSAAAAPGTGSGGAGAPGTTLSLGGGQPGADFYGSTVRNAIEARWRKPILELDAPIEVSIRFEILRDGTVRNVEVAASSGVAALDRSALRAVTDASPLPPFPASFRISSTAAIIAFELTPE
ncbi:MAG TPA: energy transducer TonB [Candidatus Polarisedimenticolaceae bacterium]|nr:energy transducer TonB [Candidatus Polarisedimenticolaceae bacterium]